MRYCPECDNLGFIPEEIVCDRCGAVTLALDDLTDEELGKQVVLTECPTIYDAMFLRAKLADEDILAIVEDEELLNSAPYGHAEPSFSVLVTLGDATVALEILRRVRSGEFALKDDELPDTDEDTGEAPCE